MNNSDMRDSIRAVMWQDNSLVLLDQRQLPQKESYITLTRCDDVAQAISDMVVRGAPAIGIAAAYGYVLALQENYSAQPRDWQGAMQPAILKLLDSRPTAVNLKWAVNRMQNRLEGLAEDPCPVALEEANAIAREDFESNITMGQYGADYIGHSRGVLTHCNTGSLATGGFGTALGVIRTLAGRGALESVYAAETRPWLQGSRLTAWELQKDNIPCTLITDSAAAALMQAGQVDWVIIGADRVAANGDVANKIGSYSHAVNARFHDIKFMVVAPLSTIDLTTPTGNNIEIEDRDSSELTSIFGVSITPDSINTYNPVFDITPAELVTALVTEQGIIEAPNAARIRAFLGPD